jgi:hypothetical protein
MERPATKVKFTHINRVIHQNRGADDTSRWGLMDVVRDVASNGRTFVDEARVYLNQ